MATPAALCHALWVLAIENACFGVRWRCFSLLDCDNRRSRLGLIGTGSANSVHDKPTRPHNARRRSLGCPEHAK